MQGGTTGQHYFSLSFFFFLNKHSSTSFLQIYLLNDKTAQLRWSRSLQKTCFLFSNQEKAAVGKLPLHMEGTVSSHYRPILPS